MCLTKRLSFPIEILLDPLITIWPEDEQQFYEENEVHDEENSLETDDQYGPTLDQTHLY